MMHSRSHSRSMPDHLCATNCRCPHPRLSSPLRSPRYATGPFKIQFAGIWQPSDPPTHGAMNSTSGMAAAWQRRRQTHCPLTPHHPCFPTPPAAEAHVCGGGCDKA